MIIKRPYAFLIKHFKLIHIILLVICSFILLKNSSITNFIKDFVSLGVYDSMNNPISNYIPGYLFALLVLVAILNSIVVLLLKYKDKPWKLYLFPTITYIGLIIIYSLILLYFSGYDGNFERTQISLYKDVLNLLSILQIPSLIVYLVRCLGVDLKKFNFQHDAEYLELDEKDQMELEVNINIDKASIKRNFRRFKRHLGYFVEEHKKIVIGAASVVVIMFVFSIYKTQFITNKAYKQNDDYKVSGYTFKIKDVYYTDKDYAGKVISKDKAFVIVELTVRNDYFEELVFNSERFHLYNGVESYIDRSNMYSTSFFDLGNVYTQQSKLGPNKSTNIILIYPVNKKLNKHRFVLFYQEKNGGNDTHLRKIKIKVKDISTIKDNGYLKLGQEMQVKYVKGQDLLTEHLAIDSYRITDGAAYTTIECIDDECVNKTNKIVPTGSNKIMIISYMTEEFEGKDIIDFSSKYGKINYIDSNNNKKSMKIENAANETYLGQYAYIEVPNEIIEAQKIELVYTIRNNKYTYQLKG